MVPCCGVELRCFLRKSGFCVRKRRNDEQRKPVDEKEKGKSARGVKSRGKISVIFLNHQLFSQLFSHYFWKCLIINGFQKWRTFTIYIFYRVLKINELQNN